ncbi:unnamed protein product, partial [Rotaria magnacalcarata]
MRLRILRKVVVNASIFFLINIILLLSIKGFHGSTNNSELRSATTTKIIREGQTTNISSLSEPLLTKKDVLLPIVVFGCNRARALQIHIEALLRIRNNSDLNPIIVSLDCHSRETLQVAKSFGDKIKKIIE